MVYSLLKSFNLDGKPNTFLRDAADYRVIKQDATKTLGKQEGHFMNNAEVAQLTSNQQVAFEYIRDFINSKHRRVFILQGYAGTGKTFLIGHIASWLLENNMVVQLLAPTGRAARVLTDKTGIPANTIHRCIYNLDELIENDAEHSNFKFYFQLKRTEADETNIVYIVDESSMVSDAESEGEFIRFGSGRLLKDLFEFSGMYDKTRLTKIIFVGDLAQLPPVNMSTSPALDANYMKSKYDIEPELYCLKEVVRQAADSAILAAATRIRNNIEREQFNELVIKPHQDEIESTTAEGVGKLWAEVYQPLKPEIPPPLICITYTNDSALRYNLLIRAALFGGSGDQQLRSGDYLMIVANNRMTGLLNGDLAVVLNADDHAIRRRVKIYSEGKEKHVELNFRRVEIAYEHSIMGQTKMECMILENALFSDVRDISPEEQKALYVDFKSRNPHLKANTPLFTQMLLEDPYFNALRVKFGYAATCHKAQGGEWDLAVVVFDSQRTDRDGLRWAYTAITRARRKLCGVNLPQKTPWSGILDGNPQPVGAWDSSPTNAPAVQPKPTENQEIPFLDAFPAELAFLRNKHCAAVQQWTAEGIQVEAVEVMPNKYYVRYRLRRGQALARLHMTFSLKARFTVQVLPAFGTDNNLANRARDILQASPHNIPIGNSEIGSLFPEDQPFLKRFYEEVVRPRSEQAGIAVISVQHMPYRERYIFEVGGRQTRVDFIYNARGQFTTYEAADEVSKSVVKSILVDA